MGTSGRKTWYWLCCQIRRWLPSRSHTLERGIARESGQDWGKCRPSRCRPAGVSIGRNFETLPQALHRSRAAIRRMCEPLKPYTFILAHRSSFLRSVSPPQRTPFVEDEVSAGQNEQDESNEFSDQNLNVWN